MIEFRDKENLDECVACVSHYGEQLAILSSISVSFGAERFELPELDQRVLQIYSRRLAARRIRVGPLTGGRSGSRTVRVHLYRGGVEPIASLAAKIGPLEDVDKEYRAYTMHVSPRLAPGCFPQYADRVDAGAASRGAVFFRLADEYARSLLDVLQQDEDAAVAALARVRQKSLGWLDARAVRTETVRDIRRLMLPDDRLSAIERFLGALPWRTIERVVLEVHVCSQHGDLHLLNILVADDDDLVLIDFARAGEAPASLDPLTLELSLVFHPDIAPVCGDWPTPQQMQQWSQLDRYVANSPYPRFVRACREWAHDVAASDLEVATTAYGYAMRQLRWSHAREFALGLVEATIRELT